MEGEALAAAPGALAAVPAVGRRRARGGIFAPGSDRRISRVPERTSTSNSRPSSNPAARSHLPESRPVRRSYVLDSAASCGGPRSWLKKRGA
jgi:hypothetical protein